MNQTPYNPWADEVYDLVLSPDTRSTARWTPDVQGKQDFDGPLLAVSTRYWPASYQPNGWPSAQASLKLVHTEAHGDYVTLFSETFEAPTEAEVKAQVEAWVQLHFHGLTRLLFTYAAAWRESGAVKPTPEMRNPQ